jgi:hypothetical protein
MTCVFFGRILKIHLDKIEVLDFVSKEIHKNIYPKGNSLLDLKEGSTYIFQGDYRKDKISVNCINPKKFLNPLYEEDLFAKSGAYTLVEVVDDPFPEAYKKYMEELKNLEDQKENNELNQSELATEVS